MSIVVAANDAEFITTLPVANMPVSRLGQPAGLFFGAPQAVGDLSGGVIQIAGSLTFDRKQEYIYEWMNFTLFSNTELAAVGGDVARLTFRTGPALPTAVSAGSLTFTDSATARLARGFSTWEFTLGQAGRSPLITYGDKSIAGGATILQVDIAGNDVATTYQTSFWGFYYLYQTFFRGLLPGNNPPRP
ncbi:MAG TPA: hypothetical protein EYO33_30030 [Phycisphaerales bacterium]|nr:hypothetical protein [Phycisphaerales bacterium]